MRFCSRCGLPVSELAEWLAGDSRLAAREGAETALPAPRRKGKRRAAKTIFWGGVLVPIFLVLSIASDSPIPLFIPFIIMLTGLSLLLYSRLFGEEVSSISSKQSQDVGLGTRLGKSALPQVSDAGIIRSGKRRMRTAEIAEPPSVTDHTTKLLDNE